jgi:hypothetical protein
MAAADAQLYRAKNEGRDRVAADGYLSAISPLANLPSSLAASIGRGDDLARIEGALGAHAAVTVTGQAGVGKTHLALASVLRTAGRFRCIGVVDVLGADSFADVSARVAAALELDDLSEAQVRLRGPVLVMLDGCERAVDACRGLIATLAFPQWCVLATSRVALDVRGEQVIRLRALDPDATREHFLELAGKAGIVADPDDPVLAAVLRRLQGSPSAIEAAVEQLAGMPAQEMLRTQRVPRGLPAQRTTIEMILERALAALEADDLAVLAAVTAFHDDCGLEDVADVSPLGGLEPARIRRVLERLAGHWLVHSVRVAGEDRWRVAAPVRRAARSAPAIRETLRAVNAAHMAWCRNRLEEVAARFGFGAGGNAEALEAAGSLVADVRLALDRGVEDESLLNAGADLCVTATRQWFEAREPEEGLIRVQAFLDRGDLLERRVSARLHVVTALLCQTLGDYARMENHARQAEQLLDEGESIERIRVMSFLAMASEYRGDYDEAESFYRRARELSRSIGYRRGEASALANIGAFLASTRLDFAEAAQACADAAAMFREIGDEIDAVIAQGNEAENLAALGELDRAGAGAAGALAEARRLGHPAVLVGRLCQYALVQEVRGEVTAAAEAICEAKNLHDDRAGMLAVIVFDIAARVAARCGADVLAAQLLEAAERTAADQSISTSALDRFWREPVRNALQLRLSPQVYAAAVAEAWAAEPRQLLDLVDTLPERARASTLAGQL